MNKRKFDDEVVEPVGNKRLESELSFQRMVSIEDLFGYTFKYAGTEYWKKLNLVPEIMRIPRGSRECVVNVLNRFLQQKENCFNVSDNRRRKSLIKNNSSEEYIILNGVMRQLSFSGILSEINLWRTSMNQSIYSWSTIQRFVSNHP